jgi:hypothetical protein
VLRFVLVQATRAEIEDDVRSKLRLRARLHRYRSRSGCSSIVRIDVENPVLFDVIQLALVARYARAGRPLGERAFQLQQLQPRKPLIVAGASGYGLGELRVRESLYGDHAFEFDRKITEIVGIADAVVVEVLSVRVRIPRE